MTGRGAEGAAGVAAVEHAVLQNVVVTGELFTIYVGARAWGGVVTAGT